jgi:hypothetical protein
MILICRFRRSLVNAQTNRFALRLARDSAHRGTLSRSRAFTYMGLWSYYVWAVRRGPTRRSAVAIPIPFEPKQRRVCLARPSTSNRRAKTSAVVSAVLSGFPVSCANFQCAEDSARYSQRIRHICPRFALYETFSAKGVTFSASLGQRPRIRGTPKQRQR